MITMLITGGAVAVPGGYMFFAYHRMKNTPVAPDSPEIKNLSDKTMLIFKNGREVDRVVGVKSKDFLLNKLNMLKYK